MLLKRIELQGFKSFADRGTIELQPGITGIIGPNGCGKSNVCDALRWVFGEQNPRLLRGNKMEDVIFNGTDNRKGIGRAEVSVTFVETEGVLPIDYHEVTITRRLFRSGESQYLINHNPCLLRDIKDLFMGTGIGTSAYFLMEQGNIDMVLSAKPEDRRSVFEEAAGILKFKLKKKASLQRLESTEANMLRLADIIREVKRQIISLERQAGKARRYQEAREELKKLELKVARREYENRFKECQTLEENIQQMTSKKNGLQENVERLQQKIEEVKKNHQSIFDEMNVLEKRDFELHHRIQNATSEIELLRNGIKELDSRIYADEEELSKARQRIEELKNQFGNEQSQHAKFIDSHKDQKKDLEDRKGSLEKIVQTYEKYQEELNAAKARLIDLKEKEAQYKNQSMVYHHRHKDLFLRREKLSSEKAKVELHSKEKQSEKEECEVLKNELNQVVQEIQQNLKGYGDQKNQIEEEKQRLVLEIEQLKENLVKCVARADAAKEFSAFQTCTAPESNLDPIFESLLDIPQEYRQALRAVLGKKSGCFIKTQRAHIQKFKGSVFFSLDTSIQKKSNDQISNLQGFIGYASKLVRFPEVYRSAAEALLGDVVILKDFESLKNVQNEWLGLYRFVTLEGDLLDIDGTWVFDRISEKETIDLEKIELEIKQLNQKIGGLQVLKEPLEQKLQQINQEITVEQEKHHLKELELAGVSGNYERIDAKLKDLSEEIWSLNREDEEIAHDIEEMEKIVTSITKNMSEIAEQSESLNAQIIQQEKEMTDLSKQKETAMEELAEVKVMTRTIEEEEKRFVNRIREIQMSIEELECLIMRRGEEVESWHKRKVEMDERIGTLDQQIQSSMQEKESLKNRSEEVKKLVQEIEKTVQQDLDLLNSQVKELNVVREQFSGLEIQRAQAVLQKDNLIQRIREKYDLDLLSWPLDAEEMPLEEVQKRILELQEKLRQMGDVNLVAIQEFDEYRSRYDFLLKQQEDLIHAKDDLIKAIQKINTTTRELFLQTFEQIKTLFNDVFRKLFGGGRAVITLMEETDVLECGIEISAQPPGKKLQSISLLSGGERTLTALALLLAVFKVRPSPFCMMDEMDAALDESNIMRFLSLLDEFRMQTQFILITHNKRTISVADAIYGVTMEESGVSKLVSLRLGETKEKDLEKEEELVPA